MKLTKKQKKINAKERHIKSKSYKIRQDRLKHKTELHRWAEEIKKRDQYCQICRSKEHLNAHHLISRSVKELSLDPDNGITLCSKHHLFDKVMSAHKGGLVFYRFILLTRPEQCERLITKIAELKSTWRDKNV